MGALSGKVVIVTGAAQGLGLAQARAFAAAGARVVVNDLGTGPNGDGIDPDGSADVLIERVSITTADDAIAIKSGTAPPTGAST